MKYTLLLFLILTNVLCNTIGVYYNETGKISMKSRKHIGIGDVENDRNLQESISGSHIPQSKNRLKSEKCLSECQKVPRKPITILNETGFEKEIYQLMCNGKKYVDNKTPMNYFYLCEEIYEPYLVKRSGSSGYDCKDISTKCECRLYRDEPKE